MPAVLFTHGTPRMTDHTPGAAVASGDVVVSQDLVRVAHLDIAANTLGALAAGGGVYKATADGAIALGKKVYWDATAKKVTLTATGNKGFGFTLTTAGADGDVIDVLHQPF